MTERERLIELIKDSGELERGGLLYNDIGFRSEQLADYLLANGVIIPQCKVGDTIYWIFAVRGFYSVVEYTVEAIQTHTSGKEIYYVSKGTKKERFFKDDFGKTIFLTREEAEKALEEVKR